MAADRPTAETADQQQTTEAPPAEHASEDAQARGLAAPIQVIEVTAPPARSDAEAVPEIEQKSAPTPANGNAAAPRPSEPAPSGTELSQPAPTVDPAKAPRIKAAEEPTTRSGQVAVFVSRKEQKIFVRQGFVPLFDMPLVIDQPDQPLGTHVFTAMERIGAGADATLRWSVVTLESPQGENAKAALDRITIPQDVLDRIASVSPRSSLIVTDEPPSSETGKGTDFVILLSDQPQGGIKFRKRGSSPEISYNGGAYYARPSRDFMTYWGPQSRPGFW